MNENTDSLAKLTAEQRELLRLRLRQRAQPRPKAGTIPRRRERAAAVELSFSQQRFWFLEQLGGASGVYHIPTAVRMRGRLDFPALARSFAALGARHETLRTVFSAVAGKPLQQVLPALEIPLPRVDLSRLPEPRREAAARELARREAARPFDLGRGPLLRLALLDLAAADSLLLLTLHHIVGDGWSMGVIVEEIAAFYAAFSQGRTATLAPLPIQYADFALWQRGQFLGELAERQLAFWRERLSGAPELELPADIPSVAAGEAPRGGAVALPLARELAALSVLAQREGATLFIGAFATFAALLSRVSGQTDLIVGTPIANRGRSETEGLIGVFVNTLALRLDLAGRPSFRELLARARTAALAAYAHQEAPFEKLVEELAPRRRPGRTPFFRVLLAPQTPPLPPLELPGLRLEMEQPTAGIQFDLTLVLREEGALQFNRNLFTRPAAQRLAGALTHWLRAALAAPDVPFTELPLLADAERQQVLVEWNDQPLDWAVDGSLPEMLSERAGRVPDAVALVLDEAHLSYGELIARADIAACGLLARGVGPERAVGVVLDRCLELPAVVIAVWKSGGTYLPLDPTYPAERLAYMLEDANRGTRPILVTRQGLRSALPEGEAFHAAGVLTVEELWREAACGVSHHPGLLPDHPAYLIYTSGSTGKPKGVLVSHRSLAHRLRWQETRIVRGKVFLQKGPISFDVSLGEIFSPLLSGGRLIVAPQTALADGRDFLRLALQHGITSLSFATPVLAIVLEHPEFLACDSVESFATGGELIPSELASRFFARSRARLRNRYGPTETTISVTDWTLVRGDDRVAPIGRPVAQTQIYLLDRHLQPVSPGVTGEIYIGGPCLARGYLGLPERTAPVFVPDPFGGGPGERLYKTGDLARYRADGAIEFLGRVDHQVKVRGYRIELGEIEAQLLRHPGVREAVVVATPDPAGSKRLAAFVVSQDPAAAPAGAELRSALAQKLPDYMVPPLIVTLAALPIHANGAKVDLQALQRLAVEAGRGLEAGRSLARVPPRTPVEELLLGLWAEVLQLDPAGFGVTDNFFELGGHSLLATRLTARVHAALGVEVPLRELFERPTIAELTVVVAEQLAAGLDEAALAELLAELG